MESEATMSKPSAAESKRKTLRRLGALHHHPEQVRNELFQQDGFFDPHDLVQVKYEMLRSVRVDRKPIRRAAQDFGFSRPSVYQARAAFERTGLPGLLPAKRGPRGAHKMDDDVMAFVCQEQLSDPALRAGGLAQRIQARFGIAVHPRTIERALRRHEKKTE
jgi:transposase